MYIFLKVGWLKKKRMKKELRIKSSEKAKYIFIIIVTRVFVHLRLLLFSALDND